MKEKVIEITNKLNTLIDASNYSVPLLDNFEIIKKDIKLYETQNTLQS